MITLGLTGGIGTGKSTVAEAFKSLGAASISADVLAHTVMKPKSRAWRQIIQAFGREVLRPDGTIDREKLAALVFSHPRKLEQLELIVHPKVLWHISRALGKYRRNGRYRLAIVEIPLLFEIGVQDLFDYNVVVSIPKSLQRKRLKQKYSWSERTITQRIQAQWSLAAKEALADFVIDNSKSVKHTQKQVNEIWHKVV